MEPIGNLLEHLVVHQFSLRLLVHLLRRVDFEVARLLDHSLSNLFERSLVLVDNLVRIKLRVVLFTCVAKIVFRIDCFTTVRHQVSIVDIDVTAEGIVVALLAFFVLRVSPTSRLRISITFILVIRAVLIFNHSHDALLLVVTHLVVSRFSECHG